MRAGSYIRIKDDLLLWQDLASQLGLPAWPCADVPDPLRALQQVYRDYLLRFEGRFSLPEQPTAAAAGLHQSPALSSATQYPSSQQQQQIGGMAAAAMLSSMQAGYLMSPGSSMQQQQQQTGMLQLQASGECPAPAAAAATADNNNFNNSLMQPGQRRLQSQFSLTGGMVLDDTLSGDLFDLLTDLIPDNDAVLPAASSAMQQQQQQPGQLATAAAEQQQQGDAAAAASSAALQRQHPEMSLVQQRHRLQQMQAQLQQQQQQQVQGLAAEVQMGAAAARAKRPPPLIRCGDSDVVSLMDQTDVNRLLHDYQQQQQQQAPHPQQQHHPALRQQQQSQSMRQQQQQQQVASGMQAIPPRPAAGQLAAAVAGAVDRAQSQDLQVLMQSYWQRQNQQQQQQQVQVPDQQQQQHVGEGGPEFEPQLEPQAANDVMSGMLEALQLADDGQAISGQQQQQQQRPAVLGGSSDQLLLVQKDESSSGEGREAAWAGHLMPARTNLLAQGSVGAHLVSLMPQLQPQSGGGLQDAASAPSGNAGSSNGSMLPPPSSQAMPAPPPRPPSAAAGAAGAGSSNGNNTQQQLQRGNSELQAFEGGLLRLTTPNSALIGSVLDSPTMRGSLGGGGGSGAGWMDISEQLVPMQRLQSNDLRGMTVEMTGPDGQAAGPSADDFAAVLQMW
jgi:hypothetical protein